MDSHLINVLKSTLSANNVERNEAEKQLNLIKQDAVRITICIIN